MFSKYQKKLFLAGNNERAGDEMKTYGKNILVIEIMSSLSQLTLTMRVVLYRARRPICFSKVILSCPKAVLPFDSFSFF